MTLLDFKDHISFGLDASVIEVLELLKLARSSDPYIDQSALSPAPRSAPTLEDLANIRFFDSRLEEPMSHDWTR